MTNNQLIVVGVGGVAIIIGIVCIIMGVISRRKLNAMAETATATVHQATLMATPAGTQRVELYGMAQSSTPLTAPASGRSCLYYHYTVEQLHRRTVTDSNGYTRTEDSWETVAEDSQSAPFTISDETGTIWVVTKGAEFVAQQTMNDSPGAYGMQSQPSGGALGGVLNTAMDFLSSDTGYYRTSESIIPLDVPVYVLGNVYQSQGGIAVAQADGPFIISYKSEAELTSKYKLHSTLWTVGGIVVGCGGIGAVIYSVGFMKG